MPQMSPMQWTLFFNWFIILMIISSVMTNFMSIYSSKVKYNKKNVSNKKIMKW